MTSYPDFHGPNVGYVLELYERYQQSPESVDAETRRFFQTWTPPTVNGAVTASNGVSAISTADLQVNTRKVFGAVNLAQAIRLYGHLAAQIDPIGYEPRPGDPELSPAAHGITEDDLRELPASLIGGPIATISQNAYEAIEKLRAVYTASIGCDFEHIRIPEERQWLREAIESRRYHFEETPEESLHLLRRLTQVEAFENFLQSSFPTKYRFSIEGLDMTVPMLDEIIHECQDTGTRTIAIAMAHRGRLNILAHVMQKPYEQILADFKDPLQLQEAQHAIGWTVGDVKYHKGVRHQLDSSGNLTITMPPNPSHLEAVNPVAIGMARAAGTKVDHGGEPVFDPNLTMQIIIHGDASFPGQGIVAETFNLSRVPGYWTGGSIHIITNNQIGFTTLPKDGRSTLYASDLAKGFRVPVIHVNADDPGACIEVARIAFAYQETFEKDFVVDLVGYRRYGHNELDEPGFTQPLMYELIRNHKTVRQLWAENLTAKSITDEASVTGLVDEYNDLLQKSLAAEPEPENPPLEPEPGAARKTVTAVTADRLLAINAGLEATLEGLNFYSKRLENTIRARRKTLDDPQARQIDWATAEELAFASILEEGIAIRLTGQDSERGTFSHRHAVLYDSESGQPLTPLQKLPQAQAAFEVRNSPLSEEAVLGFEFGYNVQAPGRLVLWEAQYGDFANGAQNIIDEFIVSAREKWGQSSSLVLLLPHGHEGAGPDHSSARPERFLQLAAKTNLRLANCTTAAQYFHLLRRQALLLETDPLPLVVMSPKSLLRNPAIASSLTDLTEGKFQPVIDDASADPEQITRLVFCSGKFYYDLIDSEFRAKYPEVALVRVEQLYPFPSMPLKEVIQRYPKIKQIVWAQEEPKNMGAWDYMSYRLRKLVKGEVPVDYVGRRRSSSPAEGSKTAYQVNQSLIVEYAFNWQFK